MSCPHCGRTVTLADLEARRCPHCDGVLKPPVGGLVKTSTVLVASGEDDLLYTSLEQVPPEIRRQLRRAIEGPDSETILIADERGREQILQAIMRLPPDVQKKVRAAIRGLPEEMSGKPPAPRFSTAVRLGLALLALALMVLWLLWVWEWRI
jgi:hypothetical protein